MTSNNPIKSLKFSTDTFDLIWPQKVLLFRAGVDLGVIAMKGLFYLIFFFFSGGIELYQKR